MVEIDHEIISTAILLPSADSSRVLSVTSKSKRTKYWLTIQLSLPKRTDPSNMTIAVDWHVKNQTNEPKLTFNNF